MLNCDSLVGGPNSQNWRGLRRALDFYVIAQVCLNKNSLELVIRQWLILDSYGTLQWVFIYDVSGTCLHCFNNLNILIGGNEPRLVDAATKQLNTLPFYHSFWNRTTKPSLVWQTFSCVLTWKRKILAMSYFGFEVLLGSQADCTLKYTGSCEGASGYVYCK